MVLTATVKLDLDPNMDKKTLKATDGALDDLIDIAEAKAVELAPVGATAGLKQGIQAVKEPFSKKLISLAPYGEFVEFGTPPRPTRPPVKALIKWVERKLKVPKDQAVSVAWAVSTKIWKEGTDPQPFMRPAFEVMKFRADGVFKKAFERIK